MRRSADLWVKCPVGLKSQEDMKLDPNFSIEIDEVLVAGNHQH